MQVPLKDLVTIMVRIVESAHDRGIDAVDIDDIDEYWIVEAPEWTQFRQEPRLSVGSLSDDWAELQRLLQGEMTTAVDYNRLAGVLRAVSDKLAPP
jgi:hypothetical protein